MARNAAYVDASPEEIFAVLADPFAYSDWVVGTQRIRGADPGWPSRGTRLFHRVGVGPIGISDRTQVLDVEENRRLVLDAAVRPLGRARVKLELHAEGAGTRVVLVEDPAGIASPLTLNPLVHVLIRRRNAESLRRLEGLVSARRGASADARGRTGTLA